MARRLRIQYSDAIYHVMARGNGRQDIVQDDADRGRLVACLERAVRRSGWSLYAFVFLTNHLHLVLQTPRPNLATGHRGASGSDRFGASAGYRGPGHRGQTGKRHISWWIGCSLSSLPRNENEPLSGLWRNENRTVAVTHFHQAVQIDV